MFLAGGQGRAAQVKVSADQVRMRSGPSLNTAVAGKLSQGQVVNALGEKNGWVYVSAGGGKGYVFGALLSSCDVSGKPLRAPGQTWVHADILSLREPVLNAAAAKATPVGSIQPESLFLAHREDLNRVLTKPMGYTRVVTPEGKTGYVRNLMVNPPVCK